MIQRRIGERSVGAIGLGCMGMSWLYGKPDNDESQRVLLRALELGVNHWDTADVYGEGENEKLLSTVLKDRRKDVFLATKFGNVYDPRMTAHQDQVEGGVGWIVDGTSEYARKCLDRSLQRLGTDHIDLYYLHRVDPVTPIEESVGAMARFVQEGKVRSIGLSEASAATIQRASRVHPIAAVQSELSLWTRDYEKTIVPLCKQLGIAFVAYSPLGRGFLTSDISRLEDLEEGDWRRRMPRFQDENMAANARIVEVVRAVAESKGVKPSQVALAWVLAQGEHVAPIPGTKRLKYLEENASAAEIRLSQEEMQTLSSVPAVKGERYAEAGMKYIDQS